MGKSKIVGGGSTYSETKVEVVNDNVQEVLWETILLYPRVVIYLAGRFQISGLTEVNGRIMTISCGAWQAEALWIKNLKEAGSRNGHNLS